MTNYRQTMAQTLEFMNIMREYKLIERELTDAEIKRREEIAQEMDDSEFKSRYGERWKEVKMAVATKQAKNEHKGKKPHKHPHPEKGPLATVDEAASWIMEAKYDIYHKTFSDAMQHAYKAAKKMYGITVNPSEIDDKVATGPSKPSAGKTNRYQLKGDKGTIQVQVANLDNKKYELNMYKEEINLDDHLDEAKIAFRTKAKDGGEFVVLHRDTKGMRGSQDKFLMRHLKKGKVKELGSHVSVDGAKKFAKNQGIIEYVELDEFTISDLKGMGIKPTPEQMKELQKINNKNKGNITRADLKKVGIKEEVELDEKFTQKDFDDNEDNNDHTQNAVELVKMFGDNYEKRQVAQIQKDHNKNRSISSKDRKVRDALIKKYLPKLEEEVELDEGPYGKEYAIIDKDNIVREKGAEKDLQKLLKSRRYAAFKGEYKIVPAPKKKVGDTVLNIGEADDPCWDGYKQVGMKKKDGKEVPNCVPEEVELEEATEKDIISALKKERIGGYFSGGKLYVAQRKLELARDLLRDLKLKTMPKLVGEEIFEFHKNIIENLLDEGRMKELHGYIEQGKSAEWIAKKMGVDVKTIKALMDEGLMNIAKAGAKAVGKKVKSTAKKAYDASPVGKAHGAVKKVGQKVGGVIKRVKQASKTGEEYDGEEEYDGSIDEASARSDAMRSMRRSGEFSDKDDDDVTATDDDVKAASKNIIMQMRKAQSLNGRFAVEFLDRKKVKVPAKIAVAVQQKYNSLRRPAEKEKFQEKVAKSYKGMLSALREALEEGTWHLPVGPKGRAGLKKLLKKPVKAKDAVDAIHDFIGDDELFDDFADLEKDDPNQDVRPTIKAAMRRLDIKEETVLDRIAIKLQERKNG